MDQNVNLALVILMQMETINQTVLIRIIPYFSCDGNRRVLTEQLPMKRSGGRKLLTNSFVADGGCSKGAGLDLASLLVPKAGNGI